MRKSQNFFAETSRDSAVSSRTASPEINDDHLRSHYHGGSDSAIDDSSRESFGNGKPRKRKLTKEKKEKIITMKNREKQKAIKSMEYLLRISEKYSLFCKGKLNKLLNTGNSSKDTSEPTNQAKINLNLDYFTGELREYQTEGVIWLTMLFDNGINGILADEMGLGKTVQIIALICHLIKRNVDGPFMVVAPLSTIPNWKAEFERFAPEIPIVVLHGNKVTRYSAKEDIRRPYKITGRKVQPVILTTYEMVSLESGYLRSFIWKYIIIDEGHRIKNHQSKLLMTLKTMTCNNKILLTGTPLQNNITELWSLLNYLMPLVFSKIDTFDSLFALENLEDENEIVQEEESNNIISSIHKVLAPFMLRRLKKDVLKDGVPKKEVTVYCPLTPLQKDMYMYGLNIALYNMQCKDVYEKPIYAVDIEQPKKKRKCIKKEGFYQLHDLYDSDSDNVPAQIINYDYEIEKPLHENSLVDKFIKIEEQRLGHKLDRNNIMFFFNVYKNNSWQALKEIVDHPYLLHYPEDPFKPGLLKEDEELVNLSGKLMVMDLLLPKLKERGHRVLIFSSFAKMLNVLEDYLNLRNYCYTRLDGSVSLEERQENITKFNTNTDVFVFLITTRAGGLGLNLTGADTVILVDRDWNPQIDNQAQDRCHRIGQTKPVVVYHLISKDTIDEKIVKVANMKKRLEKLIIKNGKLQFDKKKELDLNELKEMMKIHEDFVDSNMLTETEVEKLLDRSDLYEQMANQRKALKNI